MQTGPVRPAFSYNSRFTLGPGFTHLICSRYSLENSRGFSLLEMVVAVAILGMSLGVLYRAAGGATRIVSVDEQTAYGVELARSLLVLNAVVPASGLSEQGETEGGFAWEVVASPVEFSEEMPLAEGTLQAITVTVSWRDGDKDRKFALDSVVVGQEVLE